MNMPKQKTSWPPKHYQPVFDQIRHDEAWFTGDLTAINLYTSKDRPTPNNHQPIGGLMGLSNRMLYGKPQPRSRGNTTIERHLKTPESLCAVSASILVGKPPSITPHPVDETNTNLAETLQHVFGSDLAASELYQAALHTSALGWVIGRIRWDTTASNHPWIEWVDPDQAIIEWAGNRPKSILFWDKLDTHNKDKSVWRLLQSHTPGRITYALFEGTHDNLGMIKPFTDHPDTEYLTELVDAESGIDTGTTRLTAYPWFNRPGVPKWRNKPQLRNLGLSDISAGGGIWADIDKTWTTFMNELDSSKAKLLVSEELMQLGLPGQGRFFEMDRTVFPVAQGASADQKPTLEQVQFDIRVTEFMQTLSAAKMEAVEAVGLSPITVGMDTETGASLTATEVRAKSKRTLDTWDTKARMARAALSELATALLEVDAYLNNTQPPTMPVNVSMVAPVVNTELDEAQAIGELRTAGVASVEYAVNRLHPEWTPEQIRQEIINIKNENSVTDPFTILPPDVSPVGDTGGA